MIDSQTIVLVDGQVAEAKFDRSSTDAGSYEYTLRAKIADVTETRSDDNVQSRTINVFDRPLKVLTVAGGPMREYVFSRNVLHCNRGMSVDVWPLCSTIECSLLLLFKERFQTDRAKSL